MPSQRAICPSRHMAGTNACSSSTVGISRHSSVRSTVSGATTAARPSTSAMLARLEPFTLASAISVEAFIAAVTLTMSSGALVPNATMVRPTTSAGIRSASASWPPPRTNSSAPTTRNTRPTSRESRTRST